MNSMNENYAMEQMLKNQEAAEFDATASLAAGLEAALGSVSPDRLAEVTAEISNRGETIDHRPLRKTASLSSLGSSVPVEKILMLLYDTRESLIATFEQAGLNGDIASTLEKAIENVETCIVLSGGDVEKFVAINHVSGLVAPDLAKNAESVIATTLRCYTLGKIEEAKIQEQGKVIQISFTGSTGKMDYRADGIVTAKEWTGNEAIDYVYTPGEGNMTVKAYENGRWLIKNTGSDSRYKVAWTLKENPVGVKKQVEEKQTITQKNVVEDNGDEEIGSPIDKS